MSYETKNIRILPRYIDNNKLIRPGAYDHFCQEAEEDLYESLNFDLTRFSEAHHIYFALVHAEFDYHKPVKAGEFMDVKTVVKKVGTTSITLHYTFYKKNSREGEATEVATAERVFVAINRFDRTPRKLPSSLVEIIRRERPEAFETDSE